MNKLLAGGGLFEGDCGLFIHASDSDGRDEHRFPSIEKALDLLSEFVVGDLDAVQLIRVDGLEVEDLVFDVDLHVFYQFEG